MVAAVPRPLMANRADTSAFVGVDAARVVVVVAKVAFSGKQVGTILFAVSAEAAGLLVATAAITGASRLYA